MAKLFAAISGTQGELVLERRSSDAPWSLVGAPADLVRIGPAQFSVVIDGRSHRALVLKEDRENRTVRLRIGGRTCTVKLEEEQDRLMQTLGLDKVARKAGDLKAPMPGLVINILVKPGDQVKKNDPVLVLEAMKMENLIKAPGDGVVKAIAVEKGKPVEKGQLLVQFA
ncbi:MAG: acetyl-CoA carboxylase biotin carboxyl carrier protein subunit [Flavobacteriales bacterium]|jgi:biotin carboxyl carrier protein|nr:acetyl-CoA carboxylase biotin carboxyl carrier protein subunit [Flavobacteriales bacterium]